MHTYTICIGSNYNREENLLLAQKQLMALFPSIRFADEEETEPFLLSNPALFTNQVARFQSEEGVEQVKGRLKAIERMAGRYSTYSAASLPLEGAGGGSSGYSQTVEDIALDIDLLMCDDLVLKPQDMERDYIKRGICKLDNNKYK